MTDPGLAWGVGRGRWALPTANPREGQGERGSVLLVTRGRAGVSHSPRPEGGGSRPGGRGESGGRKA